MEKKISFLVIVGMIAILGAVFTYITYRDLNNKKDHLRKIMINRGEAIIDSFEAASREISSGDYRRKFWIQKLLIETSRLTAVKYIFISSPEGKILARSNIADTNYAELEDFAKSKKANKNLSWELLIKPESETLLLYRKLSPSFMPDKYEPKDPDSLRKHHERMNRMHNMGMEKPQGPVIRFFYRDSEILQYNPKDLSIFMALDMDMVYQSNLTSNEETIYTGIMLFSLSCAGIFLLFFIQNYRSAKISLGRAKKFTGAVIDAMPAGFITTNIEGEVISFNNASLKIFESPEKIEEFTSNLKNETDFTNTIQGQTKDIEITISLPKSKKHLDINISFINAGADEKPGFLILIKDETEKNALKKEIALNERLATVGKLAAGVAHEIRNPLSSIKGFSTCIKENPENFPQSIQISNLIINEVERLDKVVGQLLDFARPINLIKEPVILSHLLNETIQLIEREAIEKNIEIIRSFDNSITIEIDRDKIKQVFLNILYNALEATNQKGKITIELKSDDDKNILKFSDSGTGISEDAMPHIFDPYFTTKPTGTGIGLAISRNILLAHNGKIYAESSKNSDTIFYIEFPKEK
ncbi:MAG: ATP-binding protein [Desulforegulaceae bacterium]|nr:ATP-binding protein [Desulforegulaceae bacterium]